MVVDDWFIIQQGVPVLAPTVLQVVHTNHVVLRHLTLHELLCDFLAQLYLGVQLLTVWGASVFGNEHLHPVQLGRPLSGEVTQDVPPGGHPAPVMGGVGQPGYDDNGQEAGQHGQAAEGEPLAGLLVVPRVLDERRQVDQLLSAQDSQREGDEESRQAAVRVGAWHEEDAGELREEHDVHQVRAHDVQPVDALHHDSNGGAEDAHDDHAAAQHPHQLTVRRLPSVEKDNSNLKRAIRSRSLCYGLQHGAKVCMKNQASKGGGERERKEKREGERERGESERERGEREKER